MTAIVRQDPSGVEVARLRSLTSMNSPSVRLNALDTIRSHVVTSNYNPEKYLPILIMCSDEATERDSDVRMASSFVMTGIIRHEYEKGYQVPPRAELLSALNAMMEKDSDPNVLYEALYNIETLPDLSSYANAFETGLTRASQSNDTPCAALAKKIIGKIGGFPKTGAVNFFPHNMGENAPGYQTKNRRELSEDFEGRLTPSPAGTVSLLGVFNDQKVIVRLQNPSPAVRDHILRETFNDRSVNMNLVRAGNATAQGTPVHDATVVLDENTP